MNEQVKMLQATRNGIKMWLQLEKDFQPMPDEETGNQATVQWLEKELQTPVEKWDLELVGRGLEYYLRENPNQADLLLQEYRAAIDAVPYPLERQERQYKIMAATYNIAG